MKVMIFEDSPSGDKHSHQEEWQGQRTPWTMPQIAEDAITVSHGFKAVWQVAETLHIYSASQCLVEGTTGMVWRQNRDIEISLQLFAQVINETRQVVAWPTLKCGRQY